MQNRIDPASTMPFLAPTARVADTATLGAGCRIWDNVHIGERASLGDDCIVGRGAFVDHEVRVGSRCKIQNNALVYFPALIGCGVFIGPGAVLTNDLHPRAVNPDGSVKTSADWEARGVTVEDGASIGAHAVVLGGVKLGRWAAVAAGSVVTKSVSPFTLVAGVPARQIGWVGRSGRQLERTSNQILIDLVTGDRFRDLGDRIEEAE